LGIYLYCPYCGKFRVPESGAQQGSPEDFAVLLQVGVPPSRKFPSIIISTAVPVSYRSKVSSGVH